MTASVLRRTSNSSYFHEDLRLYEIYFPRLKFLITIIIMIL